MSVIYQQGTYYGKGGTGGSDNFVKGYYYNGGFYEEQAHTTPITGEQDKIYLDIPNEKCYEFDGTNFNRIDDEEIKRDTLPTASADNLGAIYLYTGADATGLRHGFFYECVSDGAGTPTYSWSELPYGHVIKDATGTVMTSRSNLQFKGRVTDDSANDATVIEAETKEISKADFDALSTAEKNNGTLYCIPDAQAVSNITVMGNRFDKANIYTTTERLIGSWMGKPLYQRTFANVTADTALITGVDTVVEAKVMNQYPLDTTIYVYGDGFDSGSMLSVKNNNGSVSIHPVGSYTYGTIQYVTLKYTKTSDGTVSIGSPNDYSTDEMIVGTWLDGKPLYQRTVEITIGSTATGVVLNGTSNNVDKLIYAYGWFEGSGAFQCIPYVGNDNTFFVIGKSKSSGNIFYSKATDGAWANMPAVITLQYTKSV